MNTLDLLLTRRSVKAADLSEPGPSSEQITTLLQAAHRVPDHGKIGPWRFIVFTGDARGQFSQKLKNICQAKAPDASEKRLSYQATLLQRAPCVITVIYSPDVEHKIPLWEQQLAVGAACQNLLIAANAMGFSGQWLSEWYSYDKQVAALLKMTPHEQVAGFFYIGSAKNKPDERVRPCLEDRIHFWQDQA